MGQKYNKRKYIKDIGVYIKLKWVKIVERLPLLGNSFYGSSDHPNVHINVSKSVCWSTFRSNLLCHQLVYAALKYA